MIDGMTSSEFEINFQDILYMKSGWKESPKLVCAGAHDAADTRKTGKSVDKLSHQQPQLRQKTVLTGFEEN